MRKIDKVIEKIVKLLKDKLRVKITSYKRLKVYSGQRKTIVLLKIEGEKDYILKIVDVTPIEMMQENDQSQMNDIKREIIALSKRIFNELEMSKKCSNLPQLRAIGQDFYRYIILENKAFMYYIEEKVEGNMLSYKDSYTIYEVIDFIMQMAINIKIMSENGYVHRDIKPNNIIENNGKYHLIDGGICKKIEDDENITVTGTMIGTTRYLAPEQECVASNMKWTFQTDLYPVGIIAVEMFVPKTRELSNGDIRDIKIIAKEWFENDNSSESEILFRKIIVNLLNEIRALRFNNIDELILEIEKVKEVIK